jgi:hypothetical protein
MESGGSLAERVEQVEMRLRQMRFRQIRGRLVLEFVD